MGTVLLVIAVFVLSFVVLYNIPRAIKFLLDKFTALVVFIFSIPARRKIAKEKGTSKAATVVAESKTEISAVQLQNIKNALENAQNMIRQKNYEIESLRKELSAAKSASQNNKIAFSENNILNYVRSLENNSRRIEYCHNTIKFLKHIANDLQSGQF